MLQGVCRCLKTQLEKKQPAFTALGRWSQQGRSPWVLFLTLPWRWKQYRVQRLTAAFTLNIFLYPPNYKFCVESDIIPLENTPDWYRERKCTAQENGAWAVPGTWRMLKKDVVSIATHNYSRAPHNDMLVNDGPRVRRWSLKIDQGTQSLTCGARIKAEGCQALVTCWLASLCLSISFALFSSPSAPSLNNSTQRHTFIYLLNTEDFYISLGL